jgi:dTDP-4-dehydrorhamnose 3,5-epimerase
MKILGTPIADLILVESKFQTDERGSFTRLYCQEELGELVGKRQIVQINQSSTRTVGTVRGLHYQRDPHAEMKLVRCIKGKVWDVAVDLRAGSPTFLHWHAEELSAENAHMMVIPEGFAHGFQVLEEDSELLYLHTAFYTPAVEGGVRPTDPQLSIAWPMVPQDLSDRDLSHPLLTSEFTGLLV